VETIFFDVLLLAAFGLLVAVTGGIAYLSAADWRDRRRRMQEAEQTRRSGKRRR
jgi:hypothetical protein